MLYCIDLLLLTFTLSAYQGIYGSRLSDSAYLTDSGSDDGDSDAEIERGHRYRSRTVNVALRHASQPISWRFSRNTTDDSPSKGLSNPTRDEYKTENVMLQEILSLKSTLKTMEEKNARSNNGFIAIVVSVAYHLVLASFCLFIVLSSKGNSQGFSYLRFLTSVLVLAIILIAESRIICIFYTALWTAFLTLSEFIMKAFVTFFVALSESNSPANKSLQFTENILTFLKSYLFHNLTVSNVLRAYLNLVVSFGNSIIAQIMFLWTGYASISELSFFSILPALATLFAVVWFCREKRAQRAVYIYLLGFGLIALYTWVLIVSKNILRLSESSRAVVFESLDYFVAPYMTFELGRLRSIFVKFAQYFGARSDVVSAVWTEALSSLQDACPHSSPEYVRQMIESELKQSIEELFVSFDMQPIASASIAQVHTATVSRTSLFYSANGTGNGNGNGNGSNGDYRPPEEVTDPSFDLHSAANSSKTTSNDVISVVVRNREDCFLMFVTYSCYYVR